MATKGSAVGRLVELRLRRKVRWLYLAAVLGLLLPVVGSLSLTSAVSPKVLIRSVSTSADTTSESTLAGCTPLPMISKTRDPYGGTLERYALPNGTVGEVHIRPVSVNFDTAPTAEDIYYGLGPRPQAGKALTLWEARAHAKVGLIDPCLAGSGNRAALGVRGASSAALGSPGSWPGTSSNWSGVVQGSSPKNAWDIIGSFDQTGFANSCGTPAYESSWEGLGGWNFVNNQQRLVQAGTTTTGGDAAYPFQQWLTENAQGQVTSGLANSLLISTNAIPPGELIIQG